jgi:hypothetical protein
MTKQLTWRLSIFAGVLAAGTGSASAQPTTCSGSLAPGSYDSVNVPAGQTCLIATAGIRTVAGNVTLGTGALLVVQSPATFVVNSSLIGVNARGIELAPAPMGAANILGNVSLSGTTGNAGIGIDQSFIGGTLSVANSNVPEIELLFNNVAGSVLVQNNKTSGVDNNRIDGNAIGGSLVCTGNMPAPGDSGFANMVGGNKVGQCSGL